MVRPNTCEERPPTTDCKPQWVVGSRKRLEV
jgi:hypothetical protein